MVTTSLSSIICFLFNWDNKLDTSVNFIRTTLLGIEVLSLLSCSCKFLISLEIYFLRLTELLTLLIYSRNIFFCGDDKVEYFSLNLSIRIFDAKICKSLFSATNAILVVCLRSGLETCSIIVNLLTTYSLGSSASAYSNNLNAAACNL